jgi:hypothetical protein
MEEKMNKYIRLSIILLFFLGIFFSGCTTKSDTSYTLSYNNGVMAGGTSPWGDGSDSHKPKLAVRFTPTSYPSTLEQVDIYLLNQSGQDQILDIHGYMDKNGIPEESSSLFDVTGQTVKQTSEAGAWGNYEVPKTQITDDSFWIVIEWGTKPLKSEQGKNSFYIGFDNPLDYNDRNLRMATSDIGWVSFPSVSATMGDAMVNVVMTK